MTPNPALRVRKLYYIFETLFLRHATLLTNNLIRLQSDKLKTANADTTEIENLMVIRIRDESIFKQWTATTPVERIGRFCVVSTLVLSFKGNFYLIYCSDDLKNHLLFKPNPDFHNFRIEDVNHFFHHMMCFYSFHLFFRLPKQMSHSWLDWTSTKHAETQKPQRVYPIEP